jgi:hypothetical protein
VVRKSDGTEIRFPNLEALQNGIRTGLVRKEDGMAREGDGFARMDELAELARLLEEADQGQVSPQDTGQRSSTDDASTDGVSPPFVEAADPPSGRLQRPASLAKSESTEGQLPEPDTAIGQSKSDTFTPPPLPLSETRQAEPDIDIGKGNPDGLTPPPLPAEASTSVSDRSLSDSDVNIIGDYQRSNASDPTDWQLVDPTVQAEEVRATIHPEIPERPSEVPEREVFQPIAETQGFEVPMTKAIRPPSEAVVPPQPQKPPERDTDEEPKTRMMSPSALQESMDANEEEEPKTIMASAPIFDDEHKRVAEEAIAPTVMASRDMMGSPSAEQLVDDDSSESRPIQGTKRPVLSPEGRDLLREDSRPLTRPGPVDRPTTDAPLTSTHSRPKVDQDLESVPAASVEAEEDRGDERTDSGIDEDEYDIGALLAETRRRNMIIVGVVFALIIIAGVVFLAMESGSSEPTDEAAKEETAAPPEKSAPKAESKGVPAEAVAVAMPEADAKSSESHDEENTADAQGAVQEDANSAPPETSKEVEAEPEAALEQGKEAAEEVPEKVDVPKEVEPKTKAAKAAGAPKERASSAPIGDNFDAVMKAARRQAGRKPKEALRLFKKALALKPDNPDAMRNVGMTYIRMNQVNRAIGVFKDCRKKAERYSPCLYWLGRAYQKGGRQVDAQKVYKKYLDKFPQSSQAADARKRLTQ